MDKGATTAVTPAVRNRLVDIQDQIEDARNTLRFIAKVVTDEVDLQDEDSEEGADLSDAERFEKIASTIRCVGRSLKGAFDLIDPLARDYDHRGWTEEPSEAPEVRS